LEFPIILNIFATLLEKGINQDIMKWSQIDLFKTTKLDLTIPCDQKNKH